MGERPFSGLAASPPSPLRGGIEGGGGAVSTEVPLTTPTPHPSPQEGGEPADAVFSNARHLRTKNIARARQLRNGATVPERHMWKLLRTFTAHRFRRQVLLGRYIADFACHQARLIIELDGDTHFTAEGIEQDRARTAYLNSIGYRVLRFTNSDIVTNLEGVWSVIDAALSTTHPSPLRGGAGGGGGEAPAVLTSPPPPSIPPLKGEGGDGPDRTVKEH